MSTPAPRKATRAFGQLPLFYLIFLAQALLPVSDFCGSPRLRGELLIFPITRIAAPQPVILKERPLLAANEGPSKLQAQLSCDEWNPL